MFAGIVLAAGASTRMGSPKALTPIQGKPAIARVIDALRRGGCDQVIAVLGADQDKIRPVIPPGTKIVTNPQWAQGKTTSVKRGLEACPAQAGFIILPVDHPAVTVTTIQRLIWSKGAIRVPVHRSQRGHPPLFEAALRSEVLALGDDQPLHDVLHKDPSRVHEVNVDDEGVLLNIDTPADAARLTKHLEGSSPARAPP